MTGTSPAAWSAAERPHVLVVTDDADLGSFLGEGLLYAGFWTSVVASGIQTLEVFRLRTFDLVLIDAALGGLSGLEVIRRLRGQAARLGSGGAGKDTPRTDVPILLVVAEASEANPTAAREAGADDVLVAPLDLEELAPRLHAVVRDWRAAHPDRPPADAAAQGRIPDA